jgi:hypothetical protein
VFSLAKMLVPWMFIGNSPGCDGYRGLRLCSRRLALRRDQCAGLSLPAVDAELNGTSFVSRRRRSGSRQ